MLDLRWFLSAALLDPKRTSIGLPGASDPSKSDLARPRERGDEFSFSALAKRRGWAGTGTRCGACGWVRVSEVHKDHAIVIMIVA